MQEQVGWLQITVHNLLLVEAFEAPQYLLEEVKCLRLSEDSLLVQVVLEALAIAVLAD